MMMSLMQATLPIARAVLEMRTSDGCDAQEDAQGSGAAEGLLLEQLFRDDLRHFTRT